MRRASDKRPSPPTPAQSDDVVHRLDRMVSRVLAGGLVVAILLLLTGAALALAGREPSPSTVTAITDIPRAVAAFEPGGFLNLGLLVLLATPVARVVALGVGFARAKSWVFCAICAVVLGLIALSAYLGVAA